MPAPKMFALLAVVVLAYLPVESYAHEIRAGELVIIHPWMPEPLRGAKAGVVYFKIQNTGQKPDELLGAESAVAESVTVHESKDVGGVSGVAPCGWPSAGRQNRRCRSRPGR